MPFALVQPVVQLSVRSLCQKSYPGHPRGCPNWNKKEGCPPEAKPLGEIMDLTRPVYLVWNRFDLGAHIDRMRIKHPKWSERQLYCCLYWQRVARYQLEEEIVRSGSRGQCSGNLILRCPEAHGVNVTATMEAAGQRDMEWPPIRVAYQVALIGRQQAFSVPME